MKYDLNLLPILLEERTVIRAAERPGIIQPALSNVLNRLRSGTCKARPASSGYRVGDTFSGRTGDHCDDGLLRHSASPDLPASFQRAAAQNCFRAG